MTVYVDSENRIHATKSNNSFREIKLNDVESKAFEGKCQKYIEGFSYDDSKGYVQIYPWKPYNELAAAQAQYELDMAEDAAIYQEGVNSAYDN